MARRVARVTMEETAIMMEAEEMIEMDTHNITSGETLDIVLHTNLTSQTC